jgi:hypothetical protein
MPRTVVSLLTLFQAVAAPLVAQLIAIKSVPVAQGDQFAIFPSDNAALGGVSIALPDTLLDPFVNPASGARVRTGRFFGSPTLFSVSRDAGGGRTLPLGALAPAGSWFGGLAAALQEVDASPRPVFFPPPGPLADPVRPSPLPTPSTLPASEQSHGNAYAFGMLGRSIGTSGVSVAASALWADLHAVDGVDLLYAGSERIRQSGNAMDLRLGLLKESAGDRSLEAVVLYNRFDMTHDVTYLDLMWDPGTQQVVQVPRLEVNQDRTDTWGVHVEHARPLGQSGWRIGGLATANRMSHPKIPNYEIVNVPRDPGNSAAFNLGVGVARIHGATTFGLDLVYEPIWSETWAEAAAPTVTLGGDTIPAGGRTLENRFRFSNAHLRIGVGQQLNDVAALQLGLALRGVHYWLEQSDLVQSTSRDHEEQWLEWTPTWGLSLRFTGLDLRYRGQVTHGTGRPGVASQPPILARDAVLAGGIIVAPSGPLTLDEVSVVTHQISIALPLR